MRRRRLGRCHASTAARRARRRATRALPTRLVGVRASTGANASEQLALRAAPRTRSRQARDTLDYDLLLTARAHARHRFRGLRVGLARPRPARATRSTLRSRDPAARRAASRRTRSRLRQRARRADVGRGGGSPVPRPRARGERRALPRRAPSRADASDCGGTIRSAASSSSPTLTVRLANEDVRQFDQDGRRARRGGHPRGASASRASSGRCAAGGISLSVPKAGRGTSPAAPTARPPVACARSTGAPPGSAVACCRRRPQWTGMYQRAAFEGSRGRAARRRARSSPRLRLGWGDGLPLQLGFPLGGDDGFPGLPSGRASRRPGGDAGHALHRARQGAAARPARAGRRRNRRQVGALRRTVDGLRACAPASGAETPVGPVRFEYGLALRGRDALFVRLGRWF